MPILLRRPRLVARACVDAAQHGAAQRAALFALGTGAAALGARGRDETPVQKTEDPKPPLDVPAPVYDGPPPMATDAAVSPPFVDAGPSPVSTGPSPTMRPMYGGPPPSTK